MWSFRKENNNKEQRTRCTLLLKVQVLMGQDRTGAPQGKPVVKRLKDRSLRHEQASGNRIMGLGVAMANSKAPCTSLHLSP